MAHSSGETRVQPPLNLHQTMHEERLGDGELHVTRELWLPREHANMQLGERFSLTDALEELQPAHAWKREIQHHRRGRGLTRQELERFHAVARRKHLESFVPQHVRHRFPRVFVVLDDQYRAARRVT